MPLAEEPHPASIATSPAGPRVLVAYDSRYGSTAEVGNAIGATLAQRGARVEVRHVETIDGIAAYDRVIVGAAIRYERWMPGAADFVRKHRRELAATPVAMFFTCLALSQPDRARETVAGYERKIRSIAPEIVPISIKGFAGVLDYSRMTPMTRRFARLLLMLRGADAGDHRNWIEITAWAEGLDREAANLIETVSAVELDHPTEAGQYVTRQSEAFDDHGD